MGVSLSGSDLTMSTARRFSIALVVGFVALAYLYGPALTGGLHQAAVDTCNTYAGGNYRSFRLTWHVGVYPHWTCADASRPHRAPVNLGWWTNPF